MPGRLTDGERVRQQDRRLDLAELDDLRRAHELAEAIADYDCRGHLVLEHVAFVRHDRSHAGADAIAFDECAMSDAHAVHVGDCVERPGIEDAEGNSEIAQARSLVLSGSCGGDGGDHHDRADRQDNSGDSR